MGVTDLSGRAGENSALTVCLSAACYMATWPEHSRSIHVHFAFV